MTQKISEIIPEKFVPIFNSILPGGSRWRSLIDDCLDSCPYYSKCCGYGPSNTLCTDDWKNTSVDVDCLIVLEHVFENFSYYNQADINERKQTLYVREIRDLLAYPLDESLTPTEKKVFMNVRLRHAEFKTKLFALWNGCSLENVMISDKYLIASHIFPWAKSNNKDKLSQYNGFLLPPNYDYLFDRHLISFENDGQILMHDIDKSENLRELYKTLGIDCNAKLKKEHMIERTFSFLDKHRRNFTKISSSLIDKDIQND